jgi:hypothetical protein
MTILGGVCSRAAYRKDDAGISSASDVPLILKILRRGASSEPGRKPAADSTNILGIIAQQ